MAALWAGEALFPCEEDRALFRVFYLWLMECFPDARAVPQKSQVSFCGKGPFCAVIPPGRWGQKSGIGLSIFLDERLENPEFLHIVNPYPNRYTHHMILTVPSQMDGVLKGFLEKAWQFKMRTGRGKQP